MWLYTLVVCKQSAESRFDMTRRNLDTQGIGKKAITIADLKIQDSGHLLQTIDGDTDIGIDGYIRIRKLTKFTRVEKNKRVQYQDYVDTGNLVGVQVKGVTEIPKTGANSYYINLKDKSKFGVNFGTKEKLNSKKEVWKNFVGPVILIFVDIENNQCWWSDLNNDDSYASNGYSVLVDKNNLLDDSAFKQIKKLGKELFVSNNLMEIDSANHDFHLLSLTDFKKSAKELYKSLSDENEPFYTVTKNPTLGSVEYSKSGWKHITRLNRRKMRIINSILLLKVSKRICETVPYFTKVKKGLVRESNRFIKKVDFLTLRANVNFNYRQKSIVQVVLRRVKTYDKYNGASKIPDKIYFHSVYEPYRKE